MVQASRSRTEIPVLPAEFVPRPDLLAELDGGADRTLTLVCAPPGYGKTLLLADWVRSGDVPTVWVALDEEDDDPRQLWSSVLAALDGCPVVPEDSRLRSLVVPRTAVDPDFLSEVVDALAALPVPLRLVLDDAHHLRTAEALRGLQLIVRHQPGTVRLVLASRLDPALSVARLRLEGRLCELRTAQLRFSPDQTAELAARSGLDLAPELTGVLHARTDGWPAGIRLAVLPLRGHPSPGRFLETFSGDERPVADYLVGEVFSHLSDEESDLLRRTSISDPLPTALATELSGRADAADVLDALERSTGLVVASGPHRTEFRFQELVRTYLTADLHRHGAQLAADLHRKAAGWWAAQGRPVEALRHAGRSGDRALLAALLHRWAPELVSRGEQTELARALDCFGTGAISADPWLGLVQAQLHLAGGDRAAARADLEETVPPLAAGGDGEADPDLDLFSAATRQLAGLSGPAAETEPAMPVGDPALEALTLVGRGTAQAFSIGAGLQPGPRSVPADLERALELARAHGYGPLEVQCLCLIGAAALISGEQARATAASDAALSAAAVAGWSGTPWAAGAHAVGAQAHLLRADPERAFRAALEGLRIASGEHDAVIRFALRCARGGALFDLGDRPTGLLALQEGHAELGGTPVPPAVAASAALLEHRSALLLDSPVAAATALHRLTAGGGHAGEAALMRAWAAAADGAARQARSAVTPLLTGDLAPTLPSTLVEAWLVETWAALRLGDRPAGRQALQTAVDLAAPMDLVRPFAFAGHGLRVLLVDQLGGVRDPGAFVFRCLAARRQAGRRPSAPGLSAREQDVLSQLISLSNLSEIADELAVSVNTVKSHVRAIYGKLGVSSRRTAVLTALERGLLA